MNYYEELGIHGDATTEQIREAYKLVARLLHPDKQREPRLKDMAECQMKRLSTVVAVLLNPQERAKYDAGLANPAGLGQLAPPAPARGPELLETVARHGFWILLGSMAIVMGLWYGLGRGPNVPRSSSPAESARVPTAPAVAQRARAPVKNRRLKPAETKAAGGAELPLRHSQGQETEPSVSATAPTTSEAPAEGAKKRPRGLPAAHEAEPSDGARSGGESRFAGEWLYSADGRGAADAGTYPATYVEFRLREEKGRLAGDYRALHIVADKAISPQVVFRVRGELPAGNTGKLGWESTAGAKGEVELTLQSPNQMQVKWWTTQFGRQEALSSGLAVLMRLKTP